MSPEICPHERDAVAWIQAELSADEARRFAEHLVGCEPCRRFLRDAEGLLQDLAGGQTRRAAVTPARAAPGGPAHPRAAPRWPARLSLVAAAAALLLALLNTFDGGTQPSVTPSTERAQLAWIEQRLSGEGTWPDEATTGLRAQQIGLHSMALLALARGASDEPTDERRAGVARAARWLIGRQNDDGSLGLAPARSDFDHVVGTRALLESWSLLGGEPLHEAAAAALAHLAAPSPARRSRAHDAQQAWRNATLARAGELGLRSHAAAIPPAPAAGWDDLALASIDAPLAHRAGLSPEPLISAALAVLRSGNR